MKQAALWAVLVSVLVGGWLMVGQRPLQAAGVVGNGTPTSCTEAALTAALSGGGSVSFNCGAAPHTITLTEAKIINADTVLDGGGRITLSGGGTTRLFQVQNGAAFTLRGLRLVDGYTTGNGGAIYAERLSHLTIEASQFSGHVAHNGGAIATNGWGASDVGVAVTIRDSAFSDNSATAPAIPGGGNGGGAIYLSGGSAATIDDTTFSGNQAGNGGAIHLLHSNLRATGVTFSDNRADNTAGGGGGGAIYMDGTKALSGALRLNRCEFRQNSTNQLGGAIFSYIIEAGATWIEDSLFDGNQSTNRGQGGAIYHQSKLGNGALTIERSLFVNNRAAAGPLDSASQGGALWLLDAPVTIRNSTFSGNEAIHAQSDALAPDNWRRGFGGAIRASSQTSISNSTLAGNAAGFVGGAVAGAATVTNSIIADNTGGNPWNIQQNCTVSLTNAGGNIQYPQKTTNLGNDYECLAGQTAVNPLLGVLSDNGGPTWTIPLLPGSPAVDGGVDADCPPTDQRSFFRVDGRCDAGAYEAGAVLFVPTQWVYLPLATR
jgi:predicted outer membrane repeat protein